MKLKLLQVLLLSSLALLPLCEIGCKTAQTVALQSAQTTDVTVETAIQAYNVFAAQGKTTVAQNQQVAAAYAKYQVAMALVCDAGAAFTTSGTNSATASSALQAAVANANTEITDVLNLIQSFGVNITSTSN